MGSCQQPNEDQHYIVPFFYLKPEELKVKVREEEQTTCPPHSRSLDGGLAGPGVAEH